MNIRVFLAAIFGVVVGSSSALAQTTYNVTCVGDITSSLQSAINSTIDGDSVVIGPGSCSMSSMVSWTDKNITVQGSGQNVTNITADSGFATIAISGANVPAFTIGGMSFSGTTNTRWAVIWGNGSATWRGGFRFTLLDVNYPNAAPDGLIQIWGMVYGLIDHNRFTQNGEAFILTSLETDTENCSYNVGGTCTLSTLAGEAGLELPYFPGGAANLYIEDNAFTSTGGNGAAALDTAYTGGRIVFRHNTLTNTTLYAHWTSGGSVNSLWWEVYNNSFTWNQGVMYPMRMQGGGTGLIYNNTIIGFQDNYILIGEGRLPSEGQSGPPLSYCNGSQSVDGNAGDASAPGWPCLAATGRDAGISISQILAGVKEKSFPLYLWNNGPQASCSNPSAGGAACDNSFSVSVYGGQNNWFKSTPHVTAGFGNGDVDYSITTSQPPGAGNHVLNYTAYQYPYTQTSGGPPPPPPAAGVCGSANGGSFSTAPATGLCSAGNAAPVSGGNGSNWTWMCDGTNGGSNASCSATFVPTPPHHHHHR
jgi:hypothetical protein